MGARRDTGAGAGLLVAAVCALGGALAAAALLGGRASGPAAPDVGGRPADGAAAGGAPAADLRAPATPTADAEATPEPGRSAAAGEPPADAYVVTARDARTGDRVLEFWVERGGIRDLGVPDDPDRTRSDPETGVARVPRGRPPRPIVLRARRYSTWRGMEPEPPGARVVASLERATTLHGFVRDAAGAPIVGARVELEFFGAAPAGFDSDAPPVTFSGATLRSADETGAYEFSGLEPGVWRTRVPWLGESSVSTKQHLTPGTWQVADHWLGARTRLVARVVPTDEPAATASRVIVTRGGDPEAHVASGYTDETGSVTLGPLPTGSYRVSVQSADGEASPQEIDVESSSPASVTIRFDLGSPGGG